VKNISDEDLPLDFIREFPNIIDKNKCSHIFRDIMKTEIEKFRSNEK